MGPHFNWEGPHSPDLRSFYREHVCVEVLNIRSPSLDPQVQPVNLQIRNYSRKHKATVIVPHLLRFPATGHSSPSATSLIAHHHRCIDGALHPKKRSSTSGRLFSASLGTRAPTHTYMYIYILILSPTVNSG